MPRHNACPNPAVSVDTTGWGGNATPTRTAVTGFLRSFAARYSGASFIETPRGAVTAGAIVTLSVYARVNGALPSTIRSYIAWYTAGGSAISFDSQSHPDLAAAVVTRLARTGTAPALAAAASLIFDNFGGILDFTAMLTELADSALPYADGDSEGWEWDGTPGVSASSESEASTGLAGRVVAGPAAAGSVTVATVRSLVGAVT